MEIDFEELKKQYYEECIYQTTHCDDFHCWDLLRTHLNPEDLFNWFKNKLTTNEEFVKSNDYYFAAQKDDHKYKTKTIKEV